MTFCCKLLHITAVFRRIRMCEFSSALRSLIRRSGGRCARGFLFRMELEKGGRDLQILSWAKHWEFYCLLGIGVADGDRPDISEQKGCGPTRGTTRLSMSGYFTLTVPAIYQQLCQRCISALRRKRNASMARECERLRSAPRDPIVFSTTGGMGAEAQTFGRRLA